MKRKQIGRYIYMFGFRTWVSKVFQVNNGDGETLVR